MSDTFDKQRDIVAEGPRAAITGEVQPLTIFSNNDDAATALAKALFLVAPNLKHHGDVAGTALRILRNKGWQLKNASDIG